MGDQSVSAITMEVFVIFFQKTESLDCFYLKEDNKI